MSNPDEESVESLSKTFGLSEIASRILVNRGLKEEAEVRRFLFVDESAVHDPFLFRDMEKAVELLLRARREGALVLVHGDYDVDGITAAAILKEFLEKNGWNVRVYIPHRMEEGYGIQPENISSFVREGVSYLVTVDCGVTANEAIELAKINGIRVIVTDHHEVKNSSLPPADALINPKVPGEAYPFRELAGVGVTYKLIQALSRYLNESDPREFLELVALGTVADMVPLLDENRFFVKEGLKQMQSTKRVGIRKLLERLELKRPTSHDVSYKVAPKLNAAGRMGSAEEAFELLTTADPFKAERLVDDLMLLNDKRRKIEREIYREAVKMIEEAELWRNPVIVVAKENWHLGVIGIVAAKLANRYEKPVVVVSLLEKVAKGSIRSSNGFNVMDIFPIDSYEIFDEIGGHSSAMGFTMRRDRLDSLFELVRNVAVESKEEKILVDAELRLSDLNEDLKRELELLMPFGQGNPEPVFLFRDLSLEKISFFGEDESNVFVVFGDGSKRVEAFGFNFRKLVETFSTVSLDFYRGDAVMSFRLLESGFSPQLLAIDIKPVGTTKWESKRLEKSQENLTKGRVSLELPYHFKARFLLMLEGKVKGRLGIVSLTNATSQNVLGCLMRYHTSTRKIGYVNSLFDRDEDQGVVLFTLAGFLRKLPIDEFELFVVNEFQEFLEHSNNDLVSDFLNLIDRYPDKFLILSSTSFDRTLLENLGFRHHHISPPEKEEFFMSDQRGRFHLEQLKALERFALVVSEKRFVPKIYGELKDLGVLIYHGTIETEKKIKLIDKIESGAAQRVIFTSNNDGLPTHVKGDIFFYDFPLSLFEIEDLLRRKAVINLCYSEENYLQRKRELELLFPSEETVEEILSIALTSVDADELKRKLSEFLETDNQGVLSTYLKLIEVSLDVENAQTKMQNYMWRVWEGELERDGFERCGRILMGEVREIYAFFQSRVKG